MLNTLHLIQNARFPRPPRRKATYPPPWSGTRPRFLLVTLHNRCGGGQPPRGTYSHLVPLPRPQVRCHSRKWSVFLRLTLRIGVVILKDCTIGWFMARFTLVAYWMSSEVAGMLPVPTPEIDWLRWFDLRDSMGCLRRYIYRTVPWGCTSIDFRWGRLRKFPLFSVPSVFLRFNVGDKLRFPTERKHSRFLRSSGNTKSGCAGVLFEF